MREDDLLWYVAYGSNLSRERFLTYLTGAPEDSRFGLHIGAHDPTEPRDSLAVVLEHDLYFGGGGSRWSGGTAVLDPTFSRSGRTFGRAWLITRGQLEAVAGQENGMIVAEIEALPVLGARVVLDVPGRYETILGLPPIKGRPAFTITSSKDHPRRPPSEAYEAVIREGLAELGTSQAAIDDYLRAHIDRS